jgi:hypothetical protein
MTASKGSPVIIICFQGIATPALSSEIIAKKTSGIQNKIVSKQYQPQNAYKVIQKVSGET